MKNIYIILVTTVTDSTPQDGQYGDAVQYKNHLFVFLFILFISNTRFTISLMPCRDIYSCKLKHCEFILFVETLMESSSLALVKIREQRVYIFKKEILDIYTFCTVFGNLNFHLCCFLRYVWLSLKRHPSISECTMKKVQHLKLPFQGFY